MLLPRYLLDLVGVSLPANKQNDLQLQLLPFSLTMEDFTGQSIWNSFALFVFFEAVDRQSCGQYENIKEQWRTCLC